MKRLLIAGIVFMGMWLQVLATPPEKGYFPYQQSSGIEVMVELCGTPDVGYYRTPQGEILLPNAQGDLCYTSWEGGKLRVTAQVYPQVRAQRGVLAAVRETPKVRAYFEQLMATAGHDGLYREDYQMSPNGLRPYGEEGPGVLKSIGAPKIPVVMVEFSDLHFSDTVTVEKVMRYLTEPGYHAEKFCAGSVKDYFHAQSNGLFEPQFEVVAKVTLPQSYAFYGKDEGGRRDVNSGAFRDEAIDLVTKSGVDLHRFENEQGEIPLVVFYHAGPGQEMTGGKATHLWSRFLYNSFESNGYRFSSYLTSAEEKRNYSSKTGKYTTDFNGIGVFCHELGHALGLPDFYYTGADAAVRDTLITMEYWSIMDYGQYAYNSYRPMGYTAFEKAFLGWAKVKEVGMETQYQLYPWGTKGHENEVYQMPVNGIPNAYYLLEYRQPGLWYPSPFGEGLLVTYVHFDEDKWKKNVLNNDPNRQLCTFVPADGVKDSHKVFGTDRSKIENDLFGGKYRTFTQAAYAPLFSQWQGAPLPFDLTQIHVSGSGPASSLQFSVVTTGIEEVSAKGQEGKRYYRLDGTRCGVPSASGLYLERQNDGSYRCIYVKQ